MCQCGVGKVCALWLLVVVFSSANWSTATIRQRVVSYDHFDDYLLSTLGSRSRAFNQVLKVEPGQADPVRPSETGNRNSTVVTSNSTVTNSSSVSDDNSTDVGSSSNPGAPMSSDELLGYFRDVPRQHWSCCMLGKLSGNKGFHCYAGFYVERLQSRNRNRVHTARMIADGHSLLPRYAAGVMRTFERCVEYHASEFHKCCYAATLERLELSRWQRYRQSRRRHSRS